MGVKQAVEDHPVVFFTTIAIAAFAAGWVAHAAIQTASGLVPISAERIKQIDSYESALMESRAAIKLLEAERDRLKPLLLAETDQSNYAGRVLRAYFSRRDFCR